MANQKIYMTPQEVADTLGIKQATARLLIKAQMNYIRIGNGRILVSTDEFDAWLKRVEHIKKGV